MGDRQDEMTIRTLQHDLAAAQDRIAELEAALEGDAGNVIHFAENAALDRAAKIGEYYCWNNGDERCGCIICQYRAAIRELIPAK